MVREYVEALSHGAVVEDVPCGNGRRTQLIVQRDDLRVIALDFNVSMLQAMQVRG